MEFPIVIVKLNNIRTLEEVVSRLSKHGTLDERPEKKEWPIGDTLKRRWGTVEGEAMGVNEIKVDDKYAYKYILMNAYVERARQTVKDVNDEFLERNDRINKVSSDVLFFENDGTVFAGIYMNLTSSSEYKINYILKDLFKTELWGTHTLLPMDYHITDMVYYWVLNKFIFGDKIINLEQDMTIQTFTGYNGVSSIDDTHTMSGDGERISALLVTLAFIFGDDSLKALKTHITFNGDNNILFELSHKGNVRVLEYDGDFFGNNERQERVLGSLVIYKNIIPEILSSYEKEFKDKDWSQGIKQHFIDKVGNMIIQRVTTKLSDSDVSIESSETSEAAFSSE